MKYTVVVTAAGSGSRMNLGYNKILYEIEPGVRIIDKAASLFQNDKRCEKIIVTLSAQDFSTHINGVVKVLGGEDRVHSVYNGLQEVTTEYVLIHDGARPYLQQKDLDKLLETLETCDACLLMTKEKDTLKEVDENGFVVKSIDRSVIWHAQTPQAFKTDLIKSCLKQAMINHIKITDDASAVELYSNVKVKAVEGDEHNIKITTRADIETH